MVPENYLDKLMAKMEAEMDRRFTKDGPRVRGGQMPPFTRQLTPEQEEAMVWSVLDGRRPGNAQEAMDILQRSLRTTRVMRGG